MSKPDARGCYGEDDSVLVGLDKCPLHRQTPFGITDVRQSQFSIARFFGGINFNGDSYTYFRKTDELIRDDVLKWKLKQARNRAK